jgi:hypothetical protein
MTPITRLAIGFGALAFASGCTAAVTSAVVADAPVLIAAASSVLANYKATPNPNPAVVTEANDLLAAAQAADVTYGATSSEALSAAAALTAYLLTSAPGNGVTPSTVPVSN